MMRPESDIRPLGHAGARRRAEDRRTGRVFIKHLRKKVEMNPRPSRMHHPSLESDTGLTGRLRRWSKEAMPCAEAVLSLLGFNVYGAPGVTRTPDLLVRSAKVGCPLFPNASNIRLFQRARSRYALGRPRMSITLAMLVATVP